MSLKKSIDLQNLPKHIAIIMDGNGRWAKEKGFLRVIGHQNGTKSVRTTVENCVDLGIKNLTLYAFSTENWNRPKLEVKTLMQLLISSLKKEVNTLQKNAVKLNAIGNLNHLPKKVQNELLQVIEATKENTKMTLTLALSYGSRDEIVNATKQICDKVKNNIISIEKIDDALINHEYEAIIDEQKRVKDSIKKTRQNKIDTTKIARDKRVLTKKSLRLSEKIDSIQK